MVSVVESVVPKMSGDLPFCSSQTLLLQLAHFFLILQLLEEVIKGLGVGILVHLLYQEPVPVLGVVVLVNVPLKMVALMMFVVMVSHPSVPGGAGDVLPLAAVGPEHPGAEAGAQHHHGPGHDEGGVRAGWGLAPVGDHQGADCDEEDEPAPDQQEHLLIEDVQGQQAHGVAFIDLSGGAVGVEIALGHLGEVHVDGVHLKLLLLGAEVVVGKEAAAVVHEPMAHQGVRHVHVEYRDEQVQKLKEGKLYAVAVVLVLVPLVAGQHSRHPVVPRGFVELWILDVLGAEADTVALEGFPDVAGDVEGDRLGREDEKIEQITNLEEEHEADPLVVVVVDLLVLVLLQ